MCVLWVCVWVGGWVHVCARVLVGMGEWELGITVLALHAGGPSWAGPRVVGIGTTGLHVDLRAEPWSHARRCLVFALTRGSAGRHGTAVWMQACATQSWLQPCYGHPRSAPLHAPQARL